MKKRIIPMVLLVITVLTVTASARVSIIRPALTISGTTAYCDVTVRSPGDDLSVTLEFWRGTTRLKSWTTSGETLISISETYQITKGYTYTLKGTYQINGSTYSLEPVSKSC